jgi:hypothetical protein
MFLDGYGTLALLFARRLVALHAFLMPLAIPEVKLQIRIGRSGRVRRKLQSIRSNRSSMRSERPPMRGHGSAVWWKPATMRWNVRRAKGMSRRERYGMFVHHASLLSICFHAFRNPVKSRSALSYLSRARSS